MGNFPWESKGFWGALIVLAAAAYRLSTGDVVGAASLFGIGLSLLGIRHAYEK